MIHGVQRLSTILCCLLSYLTCKSQVNDFNAFVDGTYDKNALRKNRIDTIIIEEVWENAGTVYHFAFNRSGNLTYQRSQHHSQENATYIGETFYTYNTAGKLQLVRSFDLSHGGNNLRYTSSFYYDKTGLLTSEETTSHFDVTDTAITVYGYSNGVIEHSVLKNSNPGYELITNYAYNIKGLLSRLETISASDNDTSVTTFTYDSKGHKLSEKKAGTILDFVSRTFTYEPSGKLITKNEEDGNDTLEIVFLYDDAGLLQKISSTGKKSWSFESYRYVKRK